MRRTKRNVRVLALFVVTVVLGLCWFFVVRFRFAEQHARPWVTKVQLSTLGRALDAFASDVGRYPTTEEGLDALAHQPAHITAWRGPYVRKDIPSDLWDTPFAYQGNVNSYSIRSYGADGRLGGDGRDADIAIAGHR
jgi:general secretion pathway protein G